MHWHIGNIIGDNHNINSNINEKETKNNLKRLLSDVQQENKYDTNT